MRDDVVAWREETPSNDRPSIPPTISAMAASDDEVDALLNLTEGSMDEDDVVTDDEIIEDSRPDSDSVPSPPLLPTIDTEVSRAGVSTNENVILNDLINPVKERYGITLPLDRLDVNLAADSRKFLLKHEWPADDQITADIIGLVLRTLDPIGYGRVETANVGEREFQLLVGVFFQALADHEKHRLKYDLSRSKPATLKSIPPTSRSPRSKRIAGKI